MPHQLPVGRMDLLTPSSLVGAAFHGATLLGLASILAVVIRRIARRVEPDLPAAVLFQSWSASQPGTRLGI
jgi:hypothetical protein